MQINKRSVALFPIKLIQFAIGIVLIAAGLAFVILFGLQFPHSPKLDGTWLIIQIHRFADPALSQAATWANVSWPSSSTSFLPLATALVTWGGKIILDVIFLRFRRVVIKLVAAPKVAGADLGLGVLAGEDASASADSEQAREQLLKRYREIESALKGAKRKRCAFLSVDIVGSTQAKVGERETDIAVTFQAYEEMLKKIFEQYGAWKQAWTPDGVMICFLQLDLAVAAAQRILQSLIKFNEADNKLRSRFRVRCGLNEGEVPIYEDSKLEKVADRVVDVAGHMQKQGAADTLWLGEEVYNRLGEKSGFRPTGQVVDGLPAYEWSLESAQKSSAAVGATN